MGCNQTKPLMNSSPSSSGIQKLKMDNGYVKGGPTFRRSSSSSSSRHNTRSGDSSRGSDGRERRATGRDDTNGGAAVGGLSRRVSSLALFGEEETVNGWPKWLVDNIPTEVLSSLTPKRADSYIKIEKVGEGTYSNVYKAREKETRKLVALKKVRFDTSEPESVKFMAREIMILQKLDHPNIIKLNGIATSRMQYSLYLVFDYMYSDLSRIITRPDQALTEPQIKCYMQQLLSGLQHCHEKGILHRDIKGSNLLIDKDGMLKIADFGLANHFSTKKKKRPLTNRVVTLWYRAPELLLGATDYGVGIDLWSAGCLLAEMFLGKPIMAGRTEVEQLHKIFKLCGTPVEEFWKNIKVSTTFRPPRDYKPSIHQTFSDLPRNVFGLLNILLDLDPSFRGSAGSALQNEFFHTSPLASELSGLPKIPIDDDDDDQEAIRRSRNSKTKHRSRSHGERRRKLDEAVDNHKPYVDYLKEDQEKSTGASSDIKQKVEEEIQDSTGIISRIRTHEDHRNAAKNRPPLPNGKGSTLWREGDNRDANSNRRRFSQVRRSASARDVQKLEQINLIRSSHDQNDRHY